MPTVRTVQRQVEQAPIQGGQRRPQQGVQLQTPIVKAAPGPESFGAGLGQAVANVGQSLAAQVLKAKEEEAARQDQTRVMSAEKDLLESSTLYLRDPESGALNRVLGNEARNLPAVAAEYFNSQQGKILNSLANERQKTAFTIASERHRQNFLNDVNVHAATQVRQFEHQEHESKLGLEAANAVFHADDPERVAQHQVSIEQEILRYAGAQGLPKEWITFETAKAKSAVWVGVIERLMNQGNDAFAKGYFDARKDDLLPGDRERLEPKLRVAIEAASAERVSNALWRQFGPKSDNDPASIDKMVDAARTDYAEKDPKLFKAIADTLRVRANDWNAGVNQRAQAGEARVWSSVLAGVSLSDLRKSPEFLGLPGTKQTQIVNTLTDQAYTLQQRARGDEQWLWSKQAHAQSVAEQREQAAIQKNYASYLRVSNPRDLIQLSEDQIINMLPVMGRTLTTNLLEKRRDLNKPEKLAEAVIDDDLFNTAAHEAGLKPFLSSSARTEIENARLGQLRNQVERVIDLEQRSKKRDLTREEKQTIMQREIDTKVMLDLWTPRPVPQSTLQPGEKTTGPARVDLRSIPDQNITEAVNFMRSAGVVPQGLSRGGAIQQYRDRIERAYAAYRRGDHEEAQRILEGK